jgi:hypothetical protein
VKPSQALPNPVRQWPSSLCFLVLFLYHTEF